MTMLPRDPARSGPSPLADFTLTRDVWLLVGLAVPIGAAAAIVALALLDGIGLVTNALWYGRLSTDLVSPADADLGPPELIKRDDLVNRVGTKSRLVRKLERKKKKTQKL